MPQQSRNSDSSERLGARFRNAMLRERRISNPFFSKIEGNRMADFRILSSDVQERVNLQGAAISYAEEVCGVGIGIFSIAELAKGVLAGIMVGAANAKGVLLGLVSATAHKLAGLEISGFISGASRVVAAVQASLGMCIADAVDKFVLQIGFANRADELAQGAWVLQFGALNFIDGKIGFPIINFKFSKNPAKKGI